MAGLRQSLESLESAEGLVTPNRGSAPGWVSALLLAFVWGCDLGAGVQAADQPQWGRAWNRNMVSGERGLPETFDPVTGKNVKWMVDLGTETHGSPVVARGRVLVGANNGQPRDPRRVGDRGVLMCFDEKDGHLVWQHVVPKREEDPYFDWPKSGMASTPTVEGDRVYLVNNRGDVVCLDLDGLANGNDGPFKDEERYLGGTNAPPAVPLGPMDADMLWKYSLPAQAGIWSHDSAHSSILIHGDYLYLNSSTGVDNTHKKIRTPDAPSLVVLHKKTGELVARDHEGIAPAIFHATWSAPALGKLEGVERVLFVGGDGILRAFELVSGWNPGDSPRSLKKVWSYDPDPTAPKTEVHRYNTNRREGPSNVHGMPVVDGDRVYLAGGGDLWWGKNEAWLHCIALKGAGDVTASARIWSYPLERHTMTTSAVSEGLVYVSDTGRLLHCVDAATGARVWTHELKGEMWASPLVADGKVYLGSRRGDLVVLKASRNKELLATVDLGAPTSSTATAANGHLYIATMLRLFKVGL